jgi:hypothetical protein
MLFGLAACAIPEPPPGGPEDKTPPSIEATVPENGAAGVAPDSPVEITFSEAMTRTKLERKVVFRPAAVLGKAKWKGRALVLEMEEPLHPDTTYVVEIEPDYSDAHGVRGTALVRFAFATSAHIDSGMISGTIHFRRKPAKRAIVRLFVLPRDSAFAPEAARPDREARTDAAGVFELGYLPNEGEAFVVWAFEDENENGNYDPDREAGAVLPDTVVLSPTMALSAGHLISIVDPKEPGSIAGKIDNRTGNDSVQITVTLHAVGDTMPVTHITRCDKEGNFTFKPILTDVFTLSAFLDLHEDSLCGAYPCPDDSTFDCFEPCAAYPDTLAVEPGDKVQLEDLLLEPQERPRSER